MDRPLQFIFYALNDGGREFGRVLGRAWAVFVPFFDLNLDELDYQLKRVNRMKSL